ncbi:MAG: biotin/lipoyl-containing protein [Candidatus Hodarchaeales archaeon]
MPIEDYSYEDTKKRRYDVKLRKKKETFTITVDGFPYKVKAKKLQDNQLEFTFNGKTYRCVVSGEDDNRFVFMDGHSYKLTKSESTAIAAAPVETADKVTAPMPGVVINILVKEGDKISANQKLIILEAMKMQNTLVAPYAGTITKIHFNVGDQVDDGALLMDIEPEEEPETNSEE